MSLKVELGFTASGASAPFFTLDDPVRGVLDSPQWILEGGEALVDVSAYVRAARVTRGKSREIDRFSAGNAVVEFNNSDRTFDPTYEASPFFGQVFPRRQIRITVDDVIQFEGTIDDWDIAYEQGGNSYATCTAIDGTQVLANLEFEGYSPVSQLSGARVNAVLDEINWSADKRDIDTGYETLEADTVTDGTNVYEYLQKVSASESGDLFIAKDGSVKFVDRNASATSSGVQLADDGSGLGYLNIETVFGTELLYNFITLSNAGTAVTASDATSIAAYGEIDLSVETLISTELAMQALADFLVTKYAAPEYRFESVDVRLDDKTPAERTDLVSVELGDIVKVTFTPSGIPPAIVRFLKVIQIDLTVRPQQEIISFGFEALTSVPLVLDDAEFGKLDSYALGW